MYSSSNDQFSPEKRPEDTMSWDFSHGDPELHVYMEQIKKIGGTVLDLAAGNLRNSRQFAENNMHVYAVDQNEAALRAGLDRISDSKTRRMITTVPADVFDFARNNIAGPYDAVLLSEFLNHAGSRPTALEAAKLGYDNVKPGGFLWLRAVSTLDGSFMRFRDQSIYDPSLRTFDDHTFHVMCNCSGTRTREPQTYLEPTDLREALELSDEDIVYERVRPTIGYPNIMAGVTKARPDTVDTTYGQISLLVKKPE